jgi:hypothetical protein
VVVMVKGTIATTTATYLSVRVCLCTPLPPPT